MAGRRAGRGHRAADRRRRHDSRRAVGGITSQIAQALGVDEFSLRQAPDGDTLASQILTVGKRLSDRAWLGYEQGLTAATGTLKFTYALTPRVSLVTRTGGDNAVDVFYNFRFD